MCGAGGVVGTATLTPLGVSAEKRTMGKSQANSLQGRSKGKWGGGASPFRCSGGVPALLCPAMGSTHRRLTLPAPVAVLGGGRREESQSKPPATVLAARERWPPLDSGARM